MRILLINHRFYPAEGGTERWTLATAQALRRKGHAVTVLSQTEPGVPDREVREGVEVRRLPMRRVGKFRVPRGYWQQLRQLDYDLLHLSGNRIWCADFYFPVASIFDGPQVITPHGFYQWEMEPSAVNRWYFERYFPKILRAFDLYLADTEREQAQITSFGYPKDRVRVPGIGIDTAELSSSVPPLGLRDRFKLTRPQIALYIGGLWENKRVDRLVRALAPLKEQVALAVGGRDLPGTRFDRAHIEALALEVGLEVRFLGVLSREEVLAAYREADLYVQGSEYEGFGVALLEAEASGLPFLAFDAGAARDLAREGGGRVVASEEEFTRLAREILTDPARHAQMRAAARRTAQLWDWENVIERYLSAYREAAAEHASR